MNSTELAEALTEWRAHQTAINVAYDALDYVAASHLEEAEIDYLIAIAEAAERLLKEPTPRSAP